MKVLVEEANQKIREKEAQNQGSKKKRKRASTRKQPASSLSPTALNWDSILDVDVELAIDCAIRKPKDAPTISGTSSPAPSLIGTPEDPPGVFASQLQHVPSSTTVLAAAALNYLEGGSPRSSYYSSPSRSPPSEMVGTDEMPTAGAGAVIAAVAALCQLSASSDP